MGENNGDPRFLYVTNAKENALWFAKENDGDIVLELKDFPISKLIVDPHDGTGDTVENEINNKFGLPAYLAIETTISSDQFYCDNLILNDEIKISKPNKKRKKFKRK